MGEDKRKSNFSDKVSIYTKAQRPPQAENEVRLMCGACRKRADTVDVSQLDDFYLSRMQNSANGKWVVVEGLCNNCSSALDDPNTSSSVTVVVAEMCRTCRKIASWSTFTWAEQLASPDIRLGDKGWWRWADSSCKRCSEVQPTQQQQKLTHRIQDLLQSARQEHADESK